MIINDASDPCGPSERLYSPSFFNAMRSALRPGGAACSQCESMWVNLSFASDMVGALAGVFEGVEYGYVMVPTYPGGGIGMILGRREEEVRKIKEQYVCCLPPPPYAAN